MNIKTLILVVALSLPSLQLIAMEQMPEHHEVLEIKSTEKVAYKMKVLLGTIGTNDRLAAITKVIQQDLSLAHEKQSGFHVTCEQFAKEPTAKADLKKLFDRGFSLVVFVSGDGSKDINYRVYDATSGAMVQGKKLTLSGYTQARAGHHVAGLLAQEFLGRSIAFGTQLAFCKQTSHKKNNKHVYVTDPYNADGYTMLVSSLTPKFGLRWFSHDEQPLLYYSEQSPVNVRLMAYDTQQKKSKMVMNFDGLNMQPSFNAAGDKVVVCCSQAGSSQLYKGTLDPVRKQWVFKRLTHNNGNNITPHLCKNDDVYFCADYETRQPQLYWYHAKDGSIERITDGGYCAGLAVHEPQGKIAYIKLIGGIAQICMYDIATKQHSQVTFDATQKDEPSWSPCGTYLAYSVEQGAYSRIAVRNLVSQEQYFVTAHNEICTSPAWSQSSVA